MTWYRQLLTMSTDEETFWLILPGRGAPVRQADKKHDELKSFGRFWYQEIRDFLNSKRTVTTAVVARLSRISTLRGFPITEISAIHCFSGTLHVLAAARRQC